MRDRALSKLITLLISNKKEFNHFFKSRSSDIVLLKLGNLNQNAKRYVARNTERDTKKAYMLQNQEKWTQNPKYNNTYTIQNKTNVDLSFMSSTHQNDLQHPSYNAYIFSNCR